MWLSKKKYQELVLIRKELQAIRSSLERIEKPNIKKIVSEVQRAKLGI